MTFDIRMGLKHVILQKLQNSCSHLLAGTSAVPKSHTDFSIDKILSDSVKDIKSSRTVSYEHNAILDLSKSSKPIPEICNLTKQVDPIPLKRTQIGCEGVIKPKVLKFWDNNGYIGSNCSACEIYYKNLNFNFNFTEQLNSNCLWTGPQNSNRQNINFPVQYVDQFHLKTRAVMSTTVSGRYNSFPIKDDEVSYKCQTCDKVFSCSYTLEAHEKTHRSPRYECSDCGKGFSQLRNYKYHLSVHRGTKEFAAECPECGKTFNDKGYLSSHMKIHRNKKEYECPYCPKSFNQRVAFNMHVRIHTGVKPHKCTECGKRFSRKMLLKQHMRTHSGEKPYQCSVCGKSFADRSNMTLHHRLHSGIKPFTCPICPKAFTKKHHLKTHLNYHTGCKPYVCPHPNCNQAFTQSSNMRTHAKKCQYRPA